MTAPNLPNFMLGTIRKSEFHQTCTTNKNRPPPVAATGTGGKAVDAAKCNQVTQDEIWKQSVSKERTGAKQWDQDWGFMAEFDPQGRPKTPKQLPDHVNMYSPNVPNTNSGNYGSRINTDIGKAMQNMEFQFNAERRKKKLGADLICY